MTDDQARQQGPRNELEVKLSDEAIEDLEPDNEGSEAVKGGGDKPLRGGLMSTGAGAGKVTF